MIAESTYNILMYSHDTYGLGHIRRTMAIASHLKTPGTNILILTGSPIAGRFTFPKQIDFVRIPGMIKKTNEEYRPLSIKMDPGQVLNIRKQLITTTAKIFQPHLFIVDKEPLGLQREILPTLKWLKRHLPATRTILGLRDVMDDSRTVIRSWKGKNVYHYLQQLYDEIWVYGIQDFYDPIAEYAIPESIAPKIRFTGYIPRAKPSASIVKALRASLHLKPDEKVVLVTIGGGGDGYRILDTYISMLEQDKAPFPIKSILISGPFLPTEQREALFNRAQNLGAITYRFRKHVEDFIGVADLVISMGGYNTLCEILSQRKLALVIPRETPRKEQLIRAQAFRKHNFITYIPWPDLSEDQIRIKLSELVQRQEMFYEHMARFPMTAYETIQQRVAWHRHGLLKNGG